MQGGERHSNLLTLVELERFKSKFTVVGDCWVWTDPLDRDGYGSFFFRKRNRKAHRVAHANWNGLIPKEDHINHRCRNRACVNPDHLQVISPAEHALLPDSNSRGAVNARKTHCKEGHPFDRIYPNAKGRKTRYCSICDRAKKKRLRAKWKELPDPLLRP